MNCLRQAEVDHYFKQSNFVQNSEQGKLHTNKDLKCKIQMLPPSQPYTCTFLYRLGWAYITHTPWLCTYMDGSQSIQVHFKCLVVVTLIKATGLQS